MAGLAEMLQRLARDLEQADAQRPEDDLRARLGYGPAEAAEAVEDVEDVEDVGDADGEAASESIWGPTAEATRKPEVVEEADSAWEPLSARGREPATGWKPAPERMPAPPVSRTPGAAYRASPPSAPAPPHHPRPSSEFLLPERIRARLHGQDALREAFVVKELLDRPLGLRRRR